MSCFVLDEKFQSVGEYDDVLTAEKALKHLGVVGKFTILKVMRNVEIELRETNPVRFRSTSPNVRGPRKPRAARKGRPIAGA